MALFGRWALITAVGSDASPTAFGFTGKLTGAAAQHTIAGSARLGDMSLTGLLAWQQDQPGLSASTSSSALPSPSWAVLTALLELTGVQPRTAARDACARQLAATRASPRLGSLAQFDGSLKLSAKGGVAGEGSELDARLQDATLFVDRASARLPHGTLGTEFTLDAGRPLPYLAASLDLRDSRCGVAGRQTRSSEPVIEGTMDLFGEATAAGSSPYDLVRTLIGRVELAMSAGQLVGDEVAPIRQALRTGPNHQGRTHHSAEVAIRQPADAAVRRSGRTLLARPRHRRDQVGGTRPR